MNEVKITSKRNLWLARNSSNGLVHLVEADGGIDLVDDKLGFSIASSTSREALEGFAMASGFEIVDGPDTDIVEFLSRGSDD
jgi:hypothetical protein